MPWTCSRRPLRPCPPCPLPGARTAQTASELAQGGDTRGPPHGVTLGISEGRGVYPWAGRTLCAGAVRALPCCARVCVCACTCMSAGTCMYQLKSAGWKMIRHVPCHSWTCAHVFVRHVPAHVGMCGCVGACGRVHTCVRGACVWVWGVHGRVHTCVRVCELGLNLSPELAWPRPRPGPRCPA